MSTVITVDDVMMLAADYGAAIGMVTIEMAGEYRTDVLMERQNEVATARHRLRTAIEEVAKQTEGQQ